MPRAKKTNAERLAQADRILNRLHERTASGSKDSFKTYGNRAAIADWNRYKAGKKDAADALNGKYYEETKEWTANGDPMVYEAEARAEYRGAQRLGLDKRVAKAEKRRAYSQSRKSQGLTTG